MKKNKYLTILDFEDGKVYQYTLEDGPHWEELYDKLCPYELFMESKGHKAGNCEWMIHDYPGVEFELE